MMICQIPNFAVGILHIKDVREYLAPIDKETSAKEW